MSTTQDKLTALPLTPAALLVTRNLLYALEWFGLDSPDAVTLTSEGGWRPSGELWSGRWRSGQTAT